MEIKECLVALLDKINGEKENERLDVRIKNATNVMVVAYAYLHKLGLTNEEILEKLKEETK